jgi:hypothetical protein
LRKSVENIQIWLKSADTVDEDVCTIYCCRLHKLALKVLCSAQYFYVADPHVAQQYTDKAVLGFHFNNGYSDAPQW